MLAASVLIVSVVFRQAGRWPVLVVGGVVLFLLALVFQRFVPAT